MKRLTIVLLSLLLCLSSFAQLEWSCIYPNKKVYFEDKDKKVHCLRVDSTSGDNTVLFPFYDIHNIGWECYSITSGSWISKYILVNEEGNTIFINGKNQQILIKNRALLDETWNLFENKIIKVKGTISSISLENVLGVEDSVKTVSLTVFDKDNEPVEHPLNQFTIKISKQFGLVKTLNFYYFEHEIIDYWHHFGEFDLIGISDPQLGFKNINLYEQYYDFKAGDEFHIYHASTSIPGEPPGGYEYKTIHRYLSRVDFDDRIEYYYERKINSAIPKDTVKQVITKGLLFETEPYELLSKDDLRKAMIINTTLPTLYFENLDFWFDPGDSCLGIVFADVCGALPTYYPGLGGPYYSCCEFWGYTYCYELVYYKKGDTEWGTPYKLDVSEYKKEHFFSIYPNPARQNISIKTANNEVLDNCMVEIFDIQGKKYLSKHLNNSEFIDVSFLNFGYYFVRLTLCNREVVYCKMIKQ